MIPVHILPYGDASPTERFLNSQRRRFLQRKRFQIKGNSHILLSLISIGQQQTLVKKYLGYT